MREKPCQSPGRMKNSSYYTAPAGDRTHDLPHTVASNMGKVSHALTHSATAAVSGCCLLTKVSSCIGTLPSTDGNLPDLPTLKSLKPEHLFMLCARNSGKDRAKRGPQRKGVHPRKFKKKKIANGAIRVILELYL